MVTVHSVRLHYVNSGGVCVCMARGLSFLLLQLGCISRQWDVWACLSDMGVVWKWQQWTDAIPPLPFTDTHKDTHIFFLECKPYFPQATMMTQILAVVSPTQINPLLDITEQQIFTSTLNLRETFSWPPWLVMSSAVLLCQHKFIFSHESLSSNQ